ncbi:MAG: response regulator [Actinomycetota bacterium]
MADPIVLVLDDDPFDQTLIASAFERVGSAAHIDLVSDVASALARFADGPTPTMALVDLKLAGESGLDFVQALRADQRTRYVPAVMLSGSDDPRDHRAAYDVGANAFVVKPSSLGAIDDLVKRLDAFWIGAVPAGPLSGR